MIAQADLEMLGADLCNRFRALAPDDKDADMRTGSALFAHNGIASAARQLRRIETLAPKRVVEIGTGKGVTTLMLARLAPSVVTIDIGGYPLRREVWEWAGLYNIVQVYTPTDADKAGLMALLDFDFVFVDGDHSVQGCALDFDLARCCGAVLFHDYTPPYPNGPLAIIEALPEAEVIKDAPFAWWGKPEIIARLRGVE